MMRSAILFTLGFAAAHASLLKRLVVTSDQEDPLPYYYQVCQPEFNDTRLPCGAVYRLIQECTYGTQATLALDNVFQLDESPTLGNRTQQICACQSDFFEQYIGCSDCMYAHGLSTFLSDVVPASTAIMSFSSSYCQLSSTPTLSFDDTLEAAFDKVSYIPGVMASDTTATWTDPIGNKTDVSYYFTPSIPASVAAQISQAAPSVSAIQTSIHTNSQGQIVNTFTASTSATGGVASSSSHSNVAAIATGTAEKIAAIGVLVVAGAAVLL